MTTIVIKHIYPADIQYSDSFSGFFTGDVVMEDDTTDMRTILNTKLNAPYPENSWDIDVMQEIFYRQGKLHIACKSEHVQLLTGRITKFLEVMIEACTEADLATVRGITRDHNPHKNPEIKFIINYRESGMKQV